MRGNPAAALESVESRIERALRDLQRGVRHLTDPLGERPPVHRREGERFEDQEVEGALWQIESWVGHAVPLHFYRRFRLPPAM